MSAERWCWLGFVDEGVGGVPEGAHAAAPCFDVGDASTRTLAAWPSDGGRRAGAGRIDRRVVDAAGPAMAVSYALAPRGVRVPFDDPAVVAATRAALRGPPVAFVSTIVRNAAHIGGAVTGIEAHVAEGWPDWWGLDAFARVFPARRLLVGAGLFRRVAPPAGPGHQRVGGLPWPVTGFA